MNREQERAFYIDKQQICWCSLFSTWNLLRSLEVMIAIHQSSLSLVSSPGKQKRPCAAVQCAGQRLAAALLPRLLGKNARSHHKGTTGRVRTGDQLLQCLCHCQLGQDIQCTVCSNLSQERGYDPSIMPELQKVQPSEEQTDWSFLAISNLVKIMSHKLRPASQANHSINQKRSQVAV